MTRGRWQVEGEENKHDVRVAVSVHRVPTRQAKEIGISFGSTAKNSGTQLASSQGRQEGKASCVGDVRMTLFASLGPPLDKTKKVCSCRPTFEC